jgi:hypothetical protein
VTTSTWIIIGGAVVFVLIMVGALVVTLVATRMRTKPVRIPGLSRFRPPRDDGTAPPDGS